MHRLTRLAVTGTSTGLGRAVAEVALEKGEIVVGTARRPSSLDDLAQRYPKDRLLVLPLDVTQPQQIIDAFAEATRTFGRIDVVFNNAGKADVGEFEGMEEAKARELLETNFWGAISVTKEAVKCFRETNPPGAGGRLLQMSSYGGLVGMPACSFYCAAKFGVLSPFDGATVWSTDFSFCPRSAGGCFGNARSRARPCVEYQSEKHPSFIPLRAFAKLTVPPSIPLVTQVTIIEPGWIRTEVAPKATWSPEHPAYQNPDLPTTYIRRVGWDKVTAWKDARRSAEAFYKVACLPDPPLHVLVGKDAINATRKKIAALTANIDTYEALSEGLEE